MPAHSETIVHMNLVLPLAMVKIQLVMMLRFKQLNNKNLGLMLLVGTNSIITKKKLFWKPKLSPLMTSVLVHLLIQKLANIDGSVRCTTSTHLIMILSVMIQPIFLIK